VSFGELGVLVVATAAMIAVVLAWQPLEGIAGGLLGVLSLPALAVGWWASALCEGDCSSSWVLALWTAGLIGLIACVAVAAAVHFKAPRAVALALLAGGWVGVILAVAIG